MRIIKRFNTGESLLEHDGNTGSITVLMDNDGTTRHIGTNTHIDDPDALSISDVKNVLAKAEGLNVFRLLPKTFLGENDMGVYAARYTDEDMTLIHESGNVFPDSLDDRYMCHLIDYVNEAD
jgi:hypothetical protein